MRKGYVLEAALILLIVVAIFVAAIVSFVSSTSTLRVSQEKLVMASNNAINGLQMGTSFIARYANTIGGFNLNFNAGQPGVASFSSIPWLQSSSQNNFFSAIYSSTDGVGWKVALSTLATNSNVLYINKIPAVQKFIQTLHATEIFSATPDIVIIQTKVGGYINNSKYFVVARSKVGGSVAYASGFVVANGLNRYVYFTQVEPSNIYFISQDSLDGPVRSNDVINIQGNPVFDGFVQAAEYNIVSGNPQFLSGNAILTPADIASMNMSMIANQYSSQINSEVVSPSYVATAGITPTPIGFDLSKFNWTSAGFSSIPDIKIVFSANGNSKTMSVYYKDSNGQSWHHLFMVNPTDGSSVPGTSQIVVNGETAAKILGLQNSSTFNFNFNGVIKTSSNLYISGDKNSNGTNDAIVAGKYTLYTTKSAYIQSNIVYEDANTLFDKSNSNWLSSPVSTSMVTQLRNSTCTDALNIVANNNVTLTSNAVSNTKLMASIYAFKGSFSYKNWDNSNPMGQLFLYGSLMQYKRGPVGTFQSSIQSMPYEIAYAFEYDFYDWGYNHLPKSYFNWFGNIKWSKVPSWLSNDYNNVINAIESGNNQNAISALEQLATDLMSNGYISSSNWNGSSWVSDWLNHYFGDVYHYLNLNGNTIITSGFYKYYAFDWRNLSGMPSNMYGTPSAQGKALLLAVRTTF
ncbi:MAG: hypothetical protein M1542_09500 [Thermotogae bacterium]|jgi:hypothetical protein|nr:hypothetical protein [Thermotogota bacterium]MCL5033461.1 hypothetical protein [Thermotogota bacterium]